MTSGGTLNVWMDEGRVTPLLEADIPFLFFVGWVVLAEWEKKRHDSTGFLSSSSPLFLFK